MIYKKDLLKEIIELKEEIKNLEERTDCYNKFNIDLLDYLGLDFNKERYVESTWFDGEKIKTKYTFKKKTKKNK